MFPRVRREIDAIRAAPTLEAFLDALWAYDRRGVYSEMRPMQLRSEFAALLRLAEVRIPRRVIEVGTASGGSLFGLAWVSAPDAVLVSLDREGTQFGSGYPPLRAEMYEAFARPGQRIELLRGDSHSEELRDRVRGLLGDGLADLLFIDGDHSYEGVRRDYELYAPLVVDGGLIAFHDVNPHPDFGVSRFWAEVKDASSVELVDGQPGQGYGIGVLKRSAG